tara:strand:+ start:230 stop:514 length:285 start_codon:yes stop_codon:yes gene_type:complete
LCVFLSALLKVVEGSKQPYTVIEMDDCFGQVRDFDLSIDRRGGNQTFAALWVEGCYADLVAAQISCTNVCFETLISTLTILHCALPSRDKDHAF